MLDKTIMEVINVIIDIMDKIDDYNRIRFVCRDTLTLSVALGWFDNIMGNDKFIQLLPRITMEETDVSAHITIEFNKDAEIYLEIEATMKRIGYKLESKGEIYGRYVLGYFRKWKKK